MQASLMAGMAADNFHVCGEASHQTQFFIPSNEKFLEEKNDCSCTQNSA